MSEEATLETLGYAEWLRDNGKISEEEYRRAVEAIQAGVGAGAKTPPVMTVDQVAAYLQVSERSIYNMAAAGEIPAAKVAGQWRFLKAEVDRWLGDLARRNLKAVDNG